MQRGFALLLVFLIFIGCAGITPQPRYRRERAKDSPSAQAGTRTIQKVETPAPDTTYKLSTDDLLDRAIKVWYGTPYELGSERVGEGVDCSGYTQAVLQSAYGLDLPRTAAQQYREGRAIPRNQLKRGDLVFFILSGGKISHVGIYLGGGLFTHASLSRGVTIDRFDDEYYRKRYAGARRVR